MHQHQNLWAILLAAGEGNRLRALTMDRNEVHRPKQFCSFGEDRSLLRRGLERAAGLVPPERMVPVVAAAHRPWWEEELWMLPPENVVVQPTNRGTAAGILLPLMHILVRDPEAMVVVVPCDHFVSQEHVLRTTMRKAVQEVARNPEVLTLLGMTPENDDPEYGWILPALRVHGHPQPVGAFVEKPSETMAAILREKGALWNSFLFVVRGSTLLSLYEQHLPDLPPRFSEWLWDTNATMEDLERIYAELPAHDFSQQVLERSAESLRVMSVPPCGWTDLGTPERVLQWMDARRVDPKSWLPLDASELVERLLHQVLPVSRTRRAS